MQPYNEYDLLLGLKNGDQSAFEILYGKYSTQLFRNIYYMVKDQELAKELLQDIFVKVWEKRTLIDPESSFKAYMITVAKNRVYNHFRQVSYETQLAAYLKYSNTEEYTHVEEEFLSTEIQSQIDVVIGRLPPQRKKIFLLCKVEGKSYEEVSQQMGISKATVNDHIVKALSFIRIELAGINTLLVLSSIL